MRNKLTFSKKRKTIYSFFCNKNDSIEFALTFIPASIIISIIEDNLNFKKTLITGVIYFFIFMAIFMFINFCIKKVLKYLLETYHYSIFSKITTWALCALACFIYIFIILIILIVIWIGFCYFKDIL